MSARENIKKILGHIKKVKKESIYNLDVDVNGSDNLITLITCTRMYGQSYHSSFTVEGRMLRDGEKVTDYTVSKTDNYKKIEKLMKRINICSIFWIYIWKAFNQ